MKDEHKHCCGKANSHSGAGCCSTHKVEHNSGKSCGCNNTHGDCGSHDHHHHHHGAEGGQCCSHGGHTASHTNCGQSACGCEHHHGSSKEMIFQFGISAAAFTAGLVCSVFFSGITVFRFYGIEVSLAIIFFAAAWAAAGFNVVLESVKNIFRGKIFDENFLMTTATLGAFILGEWSEGAAVMLFYNLGELVQHSAVEKSRRSIISLMDLRPDFARICKGANEEQIVKPEEVPIGSLIIVKPGEKIPLDGIIETGFAELDTSSMTGESIPRQAEAGSKVLAGFVNLNGVITVKTSADLKNSAASKMLELIENAQNGKAKTEKFITSFARVYTPIVTVAAVLLSILPPVFNAVFFSIPIIGFSSFAPWISRGLVFLVISCPCAFVISVPLGYFGGIGGAAKHGILIKGADYIDALARTKAAVFDKTGTLTQGVLKVMTLIPAFGIDKDKLLKITAAAELNSHHPIAKALRECAALNLSEEEYENLKSAALQNYTETAGQGITAEYNGSMIVTGKNAFVSRISKQDIPMAGDEIGGTQIYTCYGGKYLGCIILTDVIKDDSRQAVLELEKLGVERIHMLSGDNEKSARFTAEALGIKHYCASLLPHEKVSRFEDICAEVKASNKKAAIIFAGDGINDAPVLARADAGIAMGGIGSDAAIEAADIVLMNDSPVLIAEGIKLARFTKKIVWENICLAFSIKLGFLLLGALGVAGLWAAVFADVGVALLAVVNSLRPIRK